MRTMKNATTAQQRHSLQSSMFQRITWAFECLSIWVFEYETIPLLSHKIFQEQATGKLCFMVLRCKGGGAEKFYVGV